ncbi:MAG: DUF202 domain-containing protein [Gemmataceae bacterium]|nr:DUF202 domain-containing protein [Gemmataceae bacterium]
MDHEPAASSNQDLQIRMAAERTLLAWIRTGLSMIALGFVVAKFGLFLRELARATKVHESQDVGTSSWIGALLVALGVATCAMAAAQQFLLLRRLRRREPAPTPPWTLAIIMALLLAGLGMSILVYLTRVAF